MAISPFEQFKAWGRIGGLKSSRKMTKKQRIERARKAGSAKKNGAFKAAKPK